MEIISANVWSDSIEGERHPISFPPTPELVDDPVVARPSQPHDLHADGTAVRSLFLEPQQRDRGAIVSPVGGETLEIAELRRIDRVEPFPCTERGLIPSVARTLLHRLTASVLVFQGLPSAGLRVHRPLLSLLDSDSNRISCRVETQWT